MDTEELLISRGYKKRRGTVRMCICGNKFYVPPYRKNEKNLYCSTKCFHDSTISRVMLSCMNCARDYEIHKSTKKWREIRGYTKSYCSVNCYKMYKKIKYIETKKEKHTSIAKLKKHLWGVFSKYIRQRDKGICISCGKVDEWKNTDAGHYIPKTAGLSLYFDEKNVNCQCTYCNRWMHGNLSKYAIALRRKYGENILEELDQKRKEKIVYDELQYRKLIEEYKMKLLKLS